MNEPTQIAEIRPERTTSLAPRTIEEAITFSTMLAKSNMVPKEYVGKPENILVAVQWGAEIGLGPMQAMQSIAVVNNRPSLYGDALIALAYAHPKCESIQEWMEGEGDDRVAWCVAKRRGQEPTKRKFSVQDAKTAGLWGRNNWGNYPERMLQMRARGFALRDAFPDAIRGLLIYEEAQDLPPPAEKVIEPEPEDRSERLAQKLAGPTVEPKAIEEPPQVQHSTVEASAPSDGPAHPPGKGGSSPIETIRSSIQYIEGPDDANGVIDLINTSTLSPDDQRTLRHEVSEQMKKLMEGK